MAAQGNTLGCRKLGSNLTAGGTGIGTNLRNIFCMVDTWYETATKIYIPL